MFPIASERHTTQPHLRTPATFRHQSPSSSSHSTMGRDKPSNNPEAKNKAPAAEAKAAAEAKPEAKAADKGKVGALLLDPQAVSGRSGCCYGPERLACMPAVGRRTACGSPPRPCVRYVRQVNGARGS